MNNAVQKETWVLCPGCGSKTRVRVLNETVLQSFPLFCPKCKKEYLVNVENGEMTFSKQVNTDEPRR